MFVFIYSFTSVKTRFFFFSKIFACQFRTGALGETANREFDLVGALILLELSNTMTLHSINS